MGWERETGEKNWPPFGNPKTIGEETIKSGEERKRGQRKTHRYLGQIYNQNLEREIAIDVFFAQLNCPLDSAKMGKNGTRKDRGMVRKKTSGGTPSQRQKQTAKRRRDKGEWNEKELRKGEI